ncbi:MAG: Ig-like domain-containing protein [Chloroflexota bacterium]
MIKTIYNQILQRTYAKAIPRIAILLLLLSGIGICGYAGIDPLRVGIHALQTGASLTTLHQQATNDAGPPSLILLEADALVLTNDGSSTQLTARVRDAVGHPVAGLTIDFFHTTGGFTVPESTQTNDQGEVSVTFTAGSEPGQAVITARVADAAQGELTQREVIQIVKAGGNAAENSLSLNFPAMTLNPGQQASVTATLHDGAGQPLAGELVSFFGSLGEVSPASSITNANGQVVVQYTAGAVGGAGRVTALSGVASVLASFQVSVPGGSEPTATPTVVPTDMPTATPTIKPSVTATATSINDPSATATATPATPGVTPDPNGSDTPSDMQEIYLPIIQ